MATHAAPTAGWATSVSIKRPPGLFLRRFVKGRRREDERAQGAGLLRPARAIELLESVADLGENDGQLPEHARRLGTLAREEERHRLVRPRLAWPRRRHLGDRRGCARPSGDRRPGQRQLVAQVLRERRPRSPGSRAGVSGSSLRRDRPRPDERVRQVTERRACAGIERLGQLVELLDELPRLVGLPDQQFRRPVAHRRLGLARRRLRSYASRTAWKFVPPNPKALTPGPARSVGVGMKPGLSLGAEPERAVVQVELGVGGLDADRRRQDLVIERQRGVDQPGQAGGALGVADQRLDRAHDAVALVRPGFPEELAPSASISTTSPRAVPVPCAST